MFLDGDHQASTGMEAVYILACGTALWRQGTSYICHK
jgi:hypothetical protein